MLCTSLSLANIHSRGIGRQNHTRGFDTLNMAAIGSGPISVLFPCISLKITGMLSKLKIRFPQVFMPTVKMNTAMTFMASPAEAWRKKTKEFMKSTSKLQVFTLIVLIFIWRVIFYKKKCWASSQTSNYWDIFKSFNSADILFVIKRFSVEFLRTEYVHTPKNNLIT